MHVLACVLYLYPGSCLRVAKSLSKSKPVCSSIIENVV